MFPFQKFSSVRVNNIIYLTWFMTSLTPVEYTCQGITFFWALQVQCAECYECTLCQLGPFTGSWWRAWSPFHYRFFTHNSNLFQITFCCNSVSKCQIATKFCKLLDHIPFVPCANSSSNYYWRIVMNTKWNVHQIWIVMVKIISEMGPWCYPVQHAVPCYKKVDFDLDVYW